MKISTQNNLHIVLARYLEWNKFGLNLAVTVGEFYKIYNIIIIPLIDPHFFSPHALHPNRGQRQPPFIHPPHNINNSSHHLNHTSAIDHPLLRNTTKYRTKYPIRPPTISSFILFCNSSPIPPTQRARND